MSKWKEYKLGEVADFIDYRGKTPEKTKFGIPLITAKIVKKGVIQNPTEFIALSGKTAQIDHPFSDEIDHLFRSKLTTYFRSKLTT